MVKATASAASKRRTLTEQSSPLSSTKGRRSLVGEGQPKDPKKRSGTSQKEAKVVKDASPAAESEEEIPDARAAPAVTSSFSAIATASSLKKLMNKPPKSKEGISQLKCNKGVEYGIYAGYLLLVRRLISNASQKAKSSGSKQITEQHIESALKDFY